MKSCNTCIFRGISLTGKKFWKCKQFARIKRFNVACLHGWFCKWFIAADVPDTNIGKMSEIPTGSERNGEE